MFALGWRSESPPRRVEVGDSFLLVGSAGFVRPAGCLEACGSATRLFSRSVDHHRWSWARIPICLPMKLNVDGVSSYV